MTEKAEDKKKQSSGKEKAKKTFIYKPHKNCPRCGPGVWLAEHKNRRSCGKCGYYEKK